MSLFVFPTNPTTLTGAATEAKQDVMITALADINTELDAQTVLLTSLDGKDYATQTTLASLEGKDFATQTTLAALLTELQLKADLTETQPVSLASSPLPTGAATEATLSSLDGKVTAVDTTGKSTEAKQDTMITSLSNIESDINNLESRLAGNLVPEEFNDIQISYVTSGNGIGEIETVEYRQGASLVKTLTLSYDAENKLSQVTAS